MPSPKAINNAFLDACEEFGDDKSTEFLIAITADRLGIEYGDVADGLFEQAKADGKIKST